MARKKKRKTRRRSRRGGDFLRYLKFIHSGDPPRNSEEKKWCCGSYGCRNKYPEECPGFLSKIFSWGKNKKEEMEDRARMKRMKNLYNYHTTRKMNPKEKAGSYGSHCKNKEGKKWGWVAAKKGTKDMKGWRPEDQICPDYLKDCIIPERNIKYIPIQHPKNWEAPDIAFQTPTVGFKPGEVTDEGLVCRPDWRDEYCLLDPVKGMFSRKKNTDRSNKQTCLTKYRKNWPASTFAAEREDRFFNKKEQLRAIEKGYKNDYWNPDNILERQKKAKEFAKEYKKKLVTDKVQAQAQAFAKKQSGNNAEFFNAEEGNVFFNTISNSNEIPMAEPVGGRRRRRRRKTRRRRKRKSRKKRGGGWSQEIPRPAGGWINFPLGRYAIRFAGRNDWVDCILVEKDGGRFRFEKTNNEEDFFECNEAAILSKKNWIANVNPQPRSGEHTPRSKKPN